MGRFLMIPAEVIAEVRARNDLVAFIESAGVQLRRRGADYVGRCIFHNDTEPSLVVSPRKQYWCCHGACSAGAAKRVGGDVIEFARRLWGTGFKETVARLGGNGFVAESSQLPVLSFQLAEPDLLARVVEYYQKSLVASPVAREYMAARGITKAKIIDALQVGYVDGTLLERISDEMRSGFTSLGVLTAACCELFLRCIVLPLRDLAGVVVGMYGRAIDRDQHLYLPGPRRGLVNAACAATGNEIIITESVIDALSFLEAGIMNAIPIYGVNGWTADHDELLDKHRIRRIILALDSDDAGQKAAIALMNTLTSRGIDVKNIVLPEKDANEMLVKEGAAEFAQIWAKLVSSAYVVAGDLSRCALRMTEPAAPGAAKEKEAEERRGGGATANTPGKQDKPGYISTSPPPLDSSAPPTRSEDGAYVLAFEKRTYRIRGLVALGVDRLRVNVRVEHDGRFHVDTFDLYSARGRRSFQEAAIEAFGLTADAPAITKELATVIEALERERLSLRSRGRSDSAKHAISAADREKAMAFLLSPNLMDLISEDFAAIGAVGEETAMLIGYLAGLSRKCPEALAVLSSARSGAGKSIYRKRVTAFIPPEDLIEHTRVTSQALFYKDENALVHKALAIDEEEGASEAAYALRCLQSAGYLSISSTRTDPQTGKQRAEDYRVNGPTAIFLTTAHPEALDYETRNRFMMVTVDESKEQTRRILEKQRWDDTIDGLLAVERTTAILRRHHNAQRLLAPLRVVNPLALTLTYPSDRLILRREQKKYLILIKTIALLHQHQRPRKCVDAGNGRRIEYIDVTLRDVEIASQLAPAILRRNLDELAPPTRTLLCEIRRLVLAKMKEQKIPQHHAVIDRREIQQSTGLSLYHLKANIQQLVEYEYLASVTGRKGCRYVYELLWDGIEEDVAAGIKSVLKK